MKIKLASILFLAVFAASIASAREQSETDKIHYLIATVEALKSAVFIRNGAEHDPREAADHLRLKLKRAGSRVKTADDFIRLCASRSFISGKPYLIRFKDSTVLEAEVFLRNKLKAYVGERK